MKTYGEFINEDKFDIEIYLDRLNEELSLRQVRQWTMIGVIVAVIFIGTILFIPGALIHMLYKKFIGKDWRLFTRGIQNAMDIFYNLGLRVEELEGFDTHNPKIEKLLKRCKKRLNKKFPNGFTKESVIEYFKTKVKKYAKQQDYEMIDKIFDNYELREMDLDNIKSYSMKKIKELITDERIKERINQMVDEPIEDEEYDRDEWEEIVDDKIDIDEEQVYYVLSLDTIFLCGKGKYHNREIGELHFDNDEEFVRTIGKYTKKYVAYKDVYQPKRGGTSIIPVENRDVFIDILKTNWNALLKKCRVTREYIKYMTPEQLVTIIDQGYIYMQQPEEVRYGIARGSRVYNDPGIDNWGYFDINNFEGLRFLRNLKNQNFRLDLKN